MQVALAYLLEASRIASHRDRTTAGYACQLERLQRAGITEVALRGLVGEGLAKHLLETTVSNQRQRTFTASRNLRLTPASCFVLTEAGVALAENLEVRDRPWCNPANALCRGVVGSALLPGSDL